MTKHDKRGSPPCEFLRQHPRIPLHGAPELRRFTHEARYVSIPSGQEMNPSSLLQPDTRELEQGGTKMTLPQSDPTITQSDPTWSQSDPAWTRLRVTPRRSDPTWPRSDPDRRWRDFTPGQHRVSWAQRDPASSMTRVTSAAIRVSEARGRVIPCRCRVTPQRLRVAPRLFSVHSSRQQANAPLQASTFLLLAVVQT
jgi:hypothetical protein